MAAQCGPDAIWFETDVTDWDALERAVSGTVERFGGIDVVLANAGIATGGLVRSTDPAAWERVIEVNLLGVWRTVRTCLPHVIERRGYILPVASLAAAAHAPGALGLRSEQGRRGGVRRLAARRGGPPRRGGRGRLLLVDRHGDGLRRGRHPGLGDDARPHARPAGQDLPVSAAVDAIENGIDKRARRVLAPGSIKLLLAMRDFIPQFVERDVAKTMPEVERAFDADIAARGAAASAAVGAGGAADTRARDTRTEVRSTEKVSS